MHFMSNIPWISSILRPTIFLSGCEKPFFPSNCIPYCQLYTNCTIFNTERTIGIALTNSNFSISTIEFLILITGTKGTYIIVVWISTVLLLRCIYTNSDTNLQIVSIRTESYETATYKTVTIPFFQKIISLPNHFPSFGITHRQCCQWSNGLKR